MDRREFILGAAGLATVAPLLADQAAFAVEPAFRPYRRVAGPPSGTPTLFLHGGPGSTAFLFEATAQDALADAGCRIASFDQRGCGRSKPAPTGSTFTFAEAIADIDAVRIDEGLGRLTLVGHSFGGVLALKYAEAHPQNVARVVLVSAPLDYPRLFKTILANARVRYGTANKESVGYLDQIEKMDPASAEYAGYIFQHAIFTGLYRAKSLSADAQNRYRTAFALPDARLMSDAAPEPFLGFLASEHYTTSDFSPLAARIARTIPIWGMYGREDGLFDDTAISSVRAIVGESHFELVDAASHMVFADALPSFLSFMYRVNAKT